MEVLDDYKQLALEFLHDGQKNPSIFLSKRMMLELRMTLFYLAASSHTTRPQCLMPFPSCFFDRVTKTKKFDHLMKTIESLPKLDDIKEDSKFSQGKIVWELLYWVFTNPLDMVPWTNKTHDLKSSLQELQKLTTLHDIPDKGVLIFEVKNTYPKKAFSEGKKEHGTFFAYHGSALGNFHSIIHRGLLRSLNIRSAYGPGTYLSNKLATSRQYALAQIGWKKSQLKRLHSEAMDCEPFEGPSFSIQCVAIVETVNSPQVKKREVCQGITYFIVEDDEMMQLSHLLLFL